ncbi:MAG: SIR2 family NAD-dependent protein deacylase [Planctomycetota bacterium]|jgi:NAD-dependent deacetylase
MAGPDVETLAAAVEAVGRGRITVVTGAGVSLASGIPTFRGTDPDAVWKRDVTELGTYRYFREDPVGSWRWYTSRFDGVLDKVPNSAHRALAALERWHTGRGGGFLLVTQNIDTLHEDAGSHAMVKVHGSADRARCDRVGCVHAAPAGSLPRDEVDVARFRERPCEETLPRCPSCSSLLRQHVLWFDECYDEHRDYQWDRVVNAAGAMDLALFVGTSFAVGVTDLFLRAGLTRGTPMLAVDPGASEAPHPRVTLLRAPSETLLPGVCEALGLGIADTYARAGAAP